MSNRLPKNEVSVKAYTAVMLLGKFEFCANVVLPTEASVGPEDDDRHGIESAPYTGKPRPRPHSRRCL